MLTTAQKQQLGEETDEVYEDIEMELLKASAEQLSKLEPDEDSGISWSAIVAGASMLYPIQRGIVNSKAEQISQAVSRDSYAAFVLNAATELTGGEANAASIMSEARNIAQTFAPTITQNLLRNNQNVINNANSAYYQAAARAASQVANGINAKQAIKSSVSDLARRGVTYSTYTRVMNGIPQEVHVPVDVGIRREIFGDINDRLSQQVFDIAAQLGDNLVEVSFTVAPRESHAEWEGQIYQLNGAGEYQNFYAACKYGDPVEGYGGYNCGHSVSIYRGYRSFKDPTAGTGYTKEQAYALTQRQRYLENEIRKDKRERDVLKSIGYPTQDASAKLARHQRQLDALISQNSAVLVNQKWRTRVYAAASREQRRLIAEAATKQEEKRLAILSARNAEPAVRKANAKSVAMKASDNPFSAPMSDAKESRLFQSQRQQIEDSLSGNMKRLVNDYREKGLNDINRFVSNELDEYITDMIDAEYGSMWELGKSLGGDVFDKLNNPATMLEARRAFAVQKGWLKQADIDWVDILENYAGTRKYEYVNKAAREGIEAVPSAMRSMASRTNEAMARVAANTVLTEEIELTRIYRDIPESLMDVIQGKADSFTDKAVSSTTAAEGHIFSKDAQAVVHISVPKGTGKGFYADAGESLMPSNYEMAGLRADAEMEFIIKQNAVFDVEGVIINEQVGVFEIWLRMRA